MREDATRNDMDARMDDLLNKSYPRIDRSKEPYSVIRGAADMSLLSLPRRGHPDPGWLDGWGDDGE